MSAADAFATATDAELLDAARTGKADAWGALVRRYSPKMYAVARSFGLDARTAEDLVQTAWLRLLERNDQAREVASLGPWLAMVVRNDARKLVTRRRTVPVADGFEHRAAVGNAPDAGLLTDERAVALRRVRPFGRRLPPAAAPRHRRPPISYDEIAAALGRPASTLGPTRARCLEPSPCPTAGVRAVSTYPAPTGWIVPDDDGDLPDGRDMADPEDEVSQTRPTPTFAGARQGPRSRPAAPGVDQAPPSCSR